MCHILSGEQVSILPFWLMEKKLLHIGVLLVVDWILEGLAVQKKKKNWAEAI